MRCPNAPSWLGWLVACGLASPVLAAAPDPFADLDFSDELALARAAERAGDATLAAHLQPDADRLPALLSARSSPYARAPELLIAPLARLACGRDPALAPEAAHALRQIGERLTPSELATREVLRGDLHDASVALACADAKPTPRADIVATLRALRATLQALTQ